MDEWQREHWRGGVDAGLRTLESRIGTVEQEISDVEKMQREVEMKVQTLATKIAIYSSLGAFAGGGIMSVVVGLFFKH